MAYTHKPAGKAERLPTLLSGGRFSAQDARYLPQPLQRKEGPFVQALEASKPVICLGHFGDAEGPSLVSPMSMLYGLAPFFFAADHEPMKIICILQTFLFSSIIFTAMLRRGGEAESSGHPSHG
jgi:hypothetical protein